MIKCSRIDCKYYDDNTSYCKCKNVNLSYHRVNTLHCGMQSYLKCESYKESKEMQKFRKIIRENLLRDWD